MNRREAIKNIGLSAGYIAVTPAVLSLLQSCTKEIQIKWTPELLSIEEAKVLDQIVELILPETTELPGAKSLNLGLFVERYITKIAKEKEIKQFKKSAEVFNKTLGVSEENPVKKIQLEAYDAILKKYLKPTKKEKSIYEEQMLQFTQSVGSPENQKDGILYGYLSAIRGLAIWGFKTSKEIGTNALAYLPVPGEQIGCDSLEKLTGGKAWSL